MRRTALPMFNRVCSVAFSADSKHFSATSGSTVEIFVSVALRHVTSDSADLEREATVGIYKNFQTAAEFITNCTVRKNKFEVVSFGYSDTPTSADISAGSITYKIKVNPTTQPTGTGNVYVSNRYIRTLELKK